MLPTLPPKPVEVVSIETTGEWLKMSIEYDKLDYDLLHDPAGLKMDKWVKDGTPNIFENGYIVEVVVKGAVSCGIMEVFKKPCWNRVFVLQMDSLISMADLSVLLSAFKPRKLRIVSEATLDCSPMRRLRWTNQRTSTVSLMAPRIIGFDARTIPLHVTAVFTNAAVEEATIIDVLQEWLDGKREIIVWSFGMEKTEDTEKAKKPFSAKKIGDLLEIESTQWVLRREMFGDKDYYLFRASDPYPLYLSFASDVRFLRVEYLTEDNIGDHNTSNWEGFW